MSSLDDQEAIVPLPGDDDASPTTKSALSQVGSALIAVGAWTGKAAHDLYTSIDPALRQHVAESSVLGLTFVAGAATPALHLDDDGQRAVVFVHGLGGHRGNFVPMQRYFAYRGRRRTVSIGFDDTSTIEVMAEQLSNILKELCANHDLAEGSIDLIAHSMGGIICRSALLDPEIAKLVHHLVTVATPHDGTELARLLDTPKLRDLRPGSERLAALDHQVPWPKRAGFPRLTCFWSRQDIVLMPASSAILEGATVVERRECTHNGFLIRPGAIAAIFRAVTEDDPAIIGNKA